MYEREYIHTLLARIREPVRFIQVITGPRQVGKTTLATQVVEKGLIPYHFVSADAVPASDQHWIDLQWEAARLRMKAEKTESYLLVIDEVQKIPNWSEVVKKNWDYDRRKNVAVKVLLLGSSSLLIQKGLSESLTGRFELITLPHWSYTEMLAAFDFTPEEYLYFGAFPAAASLRHDQKRWREYILNSIIEVTISKDILYLTQVQKPALLKQLFELSCRYSCEILSYTKMLGQLHDAGNTTTLAHYEQLLNHNWMVGSIQKFSGSEVSIHSSIPKWIVYNTAFVSAYSEYSYEETLKNPVYLGRRIEQVIAAHLANQCRLNRAQLYYWREKNQEVDFVIKHKDKLTAIEVKKSGDPERHLGLEQFCKKHPEARKILLSNEGLSWKEFLRLSFEDIFG